MTIVVDHKLGELLKQIQLTTGIPLTPVCVNPPTTTILIATKVTHAHFVPLPPREMYGERQTRVSRFDKTCGPILHQHTPH